MKSLFVIDKLLFSKLLKFGIVGCSGMVIDFGMTYLCKEILKINKFLSNGIGFVLAATSNYFLNRNWTFNSQSEDIGYGGSIFNFMRKFHIVFYCGWTL